MNWCEINLARDSVYSTDKRRRIYRLMILYLACCSALLAVTASTATLRMMEGMTFQRQAHRIQQKFTRAHSKNVSMPTYADQLKATLEAQKKDAIAIRKALPENLKTMLPLLVALLKQTDGSKLDKLNFLQQSENTGPTLEFSIATSRSIQTYPEILNNWKNDPVLQKQFDSITPVTTSRQKRGTADIQIMSCKAAFKESTWTVQDL